MLKLISLSQGLASGAGAGATLLLSVLKRVPRGALGPAAQLRCVVLQLQLLLLLMRRSKEVLWEALERAYVSRHLEAMAKW